MRSLLTIERQNDPWDYVWKEINLLTLKKAGITGHGNAYDSLVRENFAESIGRCIQSFFFEYDFTFGK